MKSVALIAGSLHIICHGSVADVRMTEDVLAEYMQAIDGKDQISLQRGARLRRYFGEFANYDDYHRRMTPEQFKKEGNFSTSIGVIVAIWEFKAHQLRIYGGIAHVAGRRCFVGVAIDPDKKRNRADQQLLATAAKRLGRFVEFGARN
jgi:hypothetical protein